jgi:hypothetical protein
MNVENEQENNQQFYKQWFFVFYLDLVKIWKNLVQIQENMGISPLYKVWGTKNILTNYIFCHD